MPPSASKTNFKTYEAQTRLLAAVIATNNGIKLDFKGKLLSLIHRLPCMSSLYFPFPTAFHPVKTTYIALPRVIQLPESFVHGLSNRFSALAAHVGGGATKDSINHRLRPIKQLAKMQAQCLSQNKDPGELPCEKGGN
jgi:hypothetical protein